MGLVVAMGPDCRSSIGNVVGYMQFGAFAEYTVSTNVNVVSVLVHLTCENMCDGLLKYAQENND